MKALFYISFVALLVSCACTRWEIESLKIRSDCFNRNNRSANPSPDSPNDKDSPQGPGDDDPVQIIHDTTLFYSIVQFEQNYNWKQDSSIGRAGFRIDFYKNENLEFYLDSRETDLAVADPDTHHIIYGSFFTQKSTKDSTIISKNGKLFLKFKGREIIKGIVVEGDDIYTLSSLRSGQGFCYRKNGELLFGHNEGYIMGDLNDASYPDTGALYLDGEKKYFCYFTISNGKQRYFCVENGKDRELDINQSVDDIKIINGKVVDTNCNYLLEDSRVWRRGDSYLISGYIRSQFSGVVNDKGEIFRLCSAKAEILVGKTGIFGVYMTEERSVVYHSVGIDESGEVTTEVKKSLILPPNNTKAVAENRENYDNNIILSPSCISICEDTPLFALVSTNNQANAYSSSIVVGDQFTSWRMNGYVSRIFMTINPPN